MAIQWAGFELVTPITTTWCSNQLSYAHHRRRLRTRTTSCQAAARKAGLPVEEWAVLALNHAARDQLGPDIRPQPEAGWRTSGRPQPDQKASKAR